MSSVKIANHRVITPELANLPVDVLRAIPYEPVENLKTGDAPKNLWQQIVSRFTNLVIGVANFIKNGLIAIGEFIIHADIVVTKFFLNLFKTAANTVQKAVEAVERVVNAAVEWLKGTVKDVVNKFINSLLSNMRTYVVDLGTGSLKSLKEGSFDTYFFTNILPVVMGVGLAIFGLATALGYLLDSMPLVGAVALGVISAVLVSVVTSIAMEKWYYNKGQHMAHSSEDEIERELKNFRNSYGTAAYFFHGLFNLLPSAFEKYFIGGSDFNIVYTIGTFYFGLLSGVVFMAMEPTPTTGMLMTIPLAFDFAAIAGTIMDFTKIPNLISKYGLGSGIALAVVLMDIMVCATIFTISDLGYIYAAFGR